MQAVEIQTTIVDHHIDVRSELLPAYATRVKLIVMYEEADARDEPFDIVALARTARDAVAKLKEARQGVSLDGLSSQELTRDGRR
jgi:hypothetical protein